MPIIPTKKERKTNKLSPLHKLHDFQDSHLIPIAFKALAGADKTRGAHRPPVIIVSLPCGAPIASRGQGRGGGGEGEVKITRKIYTKSQKKPSAQTNKDEHRHAHDPKPVLENKDRKHRQAKKMTVSRVADSNKSRPTPHKDRRPRSSLPFKHVTRALLSHVCRHTHIPKDPSCSLLHLARRKLVIAIIVDRCKAKMSKILQ